jgi:hypothetical protein
MSDIFAFRRETNASSAARVARLPGRRFPISRKARAVEVANPGTRLRSPPSEARSRKHGGPARPGAGQGPEEHRVTPVRSGLRQPLPLAAAFRREGRPGPGKSGRKKQRRPLWDMIRGLLDSRGWRHEFTLRSQIHPRPRGRTCRLVPCRAVAAHPGQDRGRGATRGTCGTGWALHRPVNRADPGPGPTTGFGRLS